MVKNEFFGGGRGTVWVMNIHIQSGHKDKFQKSTFVLPANISK